MRGIYERVGGSGVWWIRYADALGNIHREKIGPKPLAVAAYQKRKTEVKEGKLFPNIRYNRLNFGDLCDEFKRAKPLHWSIGRKGTSRGDLFNRVRSWYADRPAALITPQAIEEKLNSLIEEKRTAATANRYRSILSSIFSWAVKNDKLPSNPVRSVPIRREDNHRIRFLDEKEEKALRAAIQVTAPFAEPDFTLALHTGLRLGEQRSLTWADVDLKRNFMFLGRTKSGRPRSIPLNGEARRALESLRSSKRERVSPGHPRWWFEKVVAGAKIDKLRWHDLRHTFASRLVMAGVDIRTVQELLGHRSIAMTMRYAHLAPRHLQAAVDAISVPAVVPVDHEKTTERPTPGRHKLTLSRGKLRKAVNSSEA